MLYIYIAIGAVIIAQPFLTHTPFMQHLFGMKGLKPVEWFYITIITFSVFVLVEIEKPHTAEERTQEKEDTRTIVNEFLRYNMRYNKFARYPQNKNYHLY